MKTITPFTAVLICLILTSTIYAQTDEIKRIEVSGGYSYTQPHELFEEPGAAHGWTLGTAYKVKKQISVYAEGGQDYGKRVYAENINVNSSRISLLGGFRFHLVNRSRLTPFVNVGLGYARFKSKLHYLGVPTNFAPKLSLLIASGGGLDVALNKKRTVSWRTSVEYRRIEVGGFLLNNAPNHGNAFRLSTGIVFNF